MVHTDDGSHRCEFQRSIRRLGSRVRHPDDMMWTVEIAATQAHTSGVQVREPTGSVPCEDVDGTTSDDGSNCESPWQLMARSGRQAPLHGHGRASKCQNN